MENQFQCLKKICESRSSCRNFKPDNIPAQEIAKIISIAELSPYAGGQKNWDIITVTNQKTKESLVSAIKDKVRECALEMDYDNAELFSNYSKNFLFFAEAPVLLIPYFRVSPVIKVLLRDNATEEMLQWERDNSVKSISCVSTLILLAAESLGLGACYMTGPLIASKQISTILNLPPGREPGAIIPIGYPLT